MQLTLFTNNQIEAAHNTHYPFKHLVTSKEKLLAVVGYDHVCAKYKDAKRSNANFLTADCLVMDCDNDHSEQPVNWVKPVDIKASFPNVAYAITFSRHHLQTKNGQVPRPKFHVYFPIQPINNAATYSQLKSQIQRHFPAFDANALDAARFVFATKHQEVIWHEDQLTVDQFLTTKETPTDTVPATDNLTVGNRNNALSHYADKLVKHFGNTKQAQQLFSERANLCHPPLPTHELASIWHSAIQFGNKVTKNADYVDPQTYNQDFQVEYQLKPDDYTDIGQARVLAENYQTHLRFTTATDFLCFNGQCWKESNELALAVVQKLTDRQLVEARQEKQKAENLLKQTGADNLLQALSKNKALQQFNPKQNAAYLKYTDACAYENFVLKRRDTRYLNACLKAAKPMLLSEINEFDQAGFLLNTPAGTFLFTRWVKRYV